MILSIYYADSACPCVMYYVCMHATHIQHRELQTVGLTLNSECRVRPAVSGYLAFISATHPPPVTKGHIYSYEQPCLNTRTHTHTHTHTHTVNMHAHTSRGLILW